MDMTMIDYKQLREDIKIALYAIEEKYGVEFSQGNITYDEFGFKLPLTAKALKVNGLNGEHAEYLALCKTYGFAPDEYKRPFICQGKQYWLTGFLPKGKKYKCKVSDGAKEYKMTIEVVRMLLDKEKGMA